MLEIMLTKGTVILLWCFIIYGVCGEDTVRSTTAAKRPCRTDKVIFDQCKSTETCDYTSVCQCRKDYERKEDGSCHPVPKPPTIIPAPQASAAPDGGFGFKLLLWLIIPVVLSAAVGAIIYTGRQKLWLNRLYRMRVRSYNNVLVSSQDEDDPPIA